MQLRCKQNLRWADFISLDAEYCCLKNWNIT